MLSPYPSHNQPQSEGRHTAWLVAVFGGLAFLFPLISVFANKGTVVLLLLTAILSVGAIRLERGYWPIPDCIFSLLLGLLVMWQLIASTWTFIQWSALELAARLGVIYASGLYLHAAAARLNSAGWNVVCRSAWLGLIAAISAMTVEYFDGQALYSLLHRSEEVTSSLAWLNHGATCLAILVFPVARWLWAIGQVRLALALPPLVAVFLMFFDSDTAKVGLVIGIVATAICLWRPRIASGLAATVVVLGLVGNPVITKSLYWLGLSENLTFNSSVRHRVHMWDYAVDRFLQRPWIGWGFDSSRSIPDDGRPLWRSTEKRLLGLHPHNGPLQLALELGLVGLVIVGALLSVLVLRIHALKLRAGRAYATGTLVTMLVMASTSYGLWQNWWVATMFIAVLLVFGSEMAARRVNHVSQSAIN